MNSTESMVSHTLRKPQIGQMVFDRKHPASSFIIPEFQEAMHSKDKSFLLPNHRNTKEQNLSTCQQMSCIEHSESTKIFKKNSNNRIYIKGKSKLILLHWVSLHRNNPYPTAEEKQELSRQTGIPIPQINTWFVNMRRRDLANSHLHIPTTIHFPGYNYQNIPYFPPNYPPFNRMQINMMPVTMTQK